MSLPSIVPTCQSEPTDYYRCPVDPSASLGRMIWSRRRSTVVSVREVAINGFTVIAPAECERVLVAMNLAVLEFQDAFFEVKTEQVSHLDGGKLWVMLELVRDVTKPSRIRCRHSFLRRSLTRFESIAAVPLFAILLITCLVMLALPGLGDVLGTANLIESMLSWMRKSFDQWVGSPF